jgi:hypothetical protein
MIKPFAKLLALLLLVSLPVVAQARQVHNIENEAIPAKLDGSVRTVAEVRDGIARAARQRGWTVAPGEGNELIASILVRNRHYAEVSISYTADTFSIKYRDSRELNYNEARNTIHRNYNNWVITLSNDIKAHL